MEWTDSDGIQRRLSEAPAGENIRQARLDAPGTGHRLIALGILAGQDDPHPGERSRQVGISKAVSGAGK